MRAAIFNSCASLSCIAALSVALAACGPNAAPPPKAASDKAAGQAQRPSAEQAGVAITGPLAPIIAPAAPAEMSDVTRRLALLIDNAKPQVKTVSIDLDGLPEATMHEPIDEKEAQKIDRKKLTEDTDLSVKPADGYARSYMLSFSFSESANITFGRVSMKGTYTPTEGWFGAGYNGTMSTYMTCGSRFKDAVPIHWESVKLENDEAVYTVADGLLERETCRILTVRKSTATAKPLLSFGVLYGFKACGRTCTEREELTVLFPRASASAAGALGGTAERAIGSYSVVSFPIQRGGGGAFMARINQQDAAAWRAFTKEKSAPHPMFPRDIPALTTMLSSFSLGVEVSQAHGDEKPIAIAYTDANPQLVLPGLNSQATTPAAPARPASRARFDFDLDQPFDLSDRR